MASRKFPVNIIENWRVLNYLLNRKKFTEYSYSTHELKGMHHRCFLGFNKPKHYQRHQRNSWLLWQKTLTNRREHVYYNGTNSGMFDVICWVPQDSVSGPFLFLIDIKDIGSSSTFKFTPLADDTNIFKKDIAFNRNN